jgi:hypothetical protein
MEQLEQSGDFVGDCRRLFAPEHGRRWKTAAADALAIGRTTLYRYLNGEQPVPAAVRARLAALAKRPASPYASRWRRSTAAWPNTTRTAGSATAGSTRTGGPAPANTAVIASEAIPLRLASS